MNLWLKKGTQKMLSKLGKVDISIDQEYNRYQNEFNQEKKNTAEVIRNIGTVVKNFSDVSQSIKKFANNLSKSFKDDDPMKEYLKSIETTMTGFEQNSLKPFKERVVKNCVESVKKYQSKFSKVKPSMNTREETKLKFDKLTSNVKRMINKPQKDPSKLPREKEKLKAAAKSYNTAALNAKTSLGSLLDEVGEVYDPVVTELCESTVELCNEMASAFQKMAMIANEIKSSDIDREKRPVSSVVDSEEVDEEDYFEKLDAKKKDLKKKPVKKQKKNVGSVKGSSGSGSGSGGSSEFGNTDWYYLDNDVQQQGPYSFDEMKGLYSNGTIDGETHVFGGSLEDWKTVSDFKPFEKALSS